MKLKEEKRGGAIFAFAFALALAVRFEIVAESMLRSIFEGRLMKREGQITAEDG